MTAPVDGGGWPDAAATDAAATAGGMTGGGMTGGAANQGAGAGVLAPSRADPFVRGVSELIGGPLGRHARTVRSFATPVLLGLTLLTCLLGWAQKASCLSHPWVRDYQYTRMCYSDVYALYYAEGLSNGAVPYADHPVEYPVLTGAAMEVAAKAAHLGPSADRGQAFFDATAVLLAAAALVTTYTTARLAGRRRVWDAAMVALAPVLLLHVDTNWDMLAAALAGVGLLAWARCRPVWAGVWLGLGTAAKLYPLLLFVPLLLLCVRERRLRPFLLSVIGGLVAWLAVDLPVWLTWPASFGRFWSLNRTRVADWDTVWLWLQHAVRWYPPVSTLNLAVGAAFGAVLVAIAVLVLTAPTRPRVAQVAFLVVVGFLLTNKVDSPQYVLWILPLAVLARPRWPAFLAWQATEFAVLVTRFYYFVSNDHPGQGVPYGWFGAAVLTRDAALLVLAGLVVREVWRPALDVVRTAGVDDPMAGPLAVTEAGHRPLRPASVPAPG